MHTNMVRSTEAQEREINAEFKSYNTFLSLRNCDRWRPDWKVRNNLDFPKKCADCNYLTMIKGADLAHLLKLKLQIKVCRVSKWVCGCGKYAVVQLISKMWEKSLEKY